MHNYILKVIVLLSIISSSAYAYTSLKYGLPESEESLRAQSNIMKDKETFLVKKTLTRRVSEILIHPNCSACDASLNHAILRLAESFSLSRKLNIICLPTFEQIDVADDCGQPNTCELIDISKQDGSIYVHSSCERGKNNTDLILDISAQLESCEIPCGSDQFFYFGMNIDILYNCNYRTIIMAKNDDLYDNLNWITSILLDKF